MNVMYVFEHIPIRNDNGIDIKSMSISWLKNCNENEKMV